MEALLFLSELLITRAWGWREEGWRERGGEGGEGEEGGGRMIRRKEKEREM